MCPFLQGSLPVRMLLPLSFPLFLPASYGRRARHQGFPLLPRLSFLLLFSPCHTRSPFSFSHPTSNTLNMDPPLSASRCSFFTGHLRPLVEGRKSSPFPIFGTIRRWPSTGEEAPERLSLEELPVGSLFPARVFLSPDS